MLCLMVANSHSTGNTAMEDADTSKNNITNKDLISENEDLREQLKHNDEAITCLAIKKEEVKLEKMNEKEILKQLQSQNIFYECQNNCNSDDDSEISDAEMLKRMEELEKDNFCLEAEIEVLKERVVEQYDDVKLLRGSGQEEPYNGIRMDILHRDEDIKTHFMDMKEEYKQLSKDVIDVLKEKQNLLNEQIEYKNQIGQLEENLQTQMKNSKEMPQVKNIDSILLESVQMYGQLAVQGETTQEAVKDLEQSKQDLESALKARRRSWTGADPPIAPVTVPQIQKHLENLGRTQHAMDEDQIMENLVNTAAILTEALEVKTKASNYNIKVKRLLGRRIQYMEDVIKNLTELGLIEDSIAGEEPELPPQFSIKTKKLRSSSSCWDENVKFVNLECELPYEDARQHDVLLM